MNDLSWIIYFLDRYDNFKGALWFIGVSVFLISTVGIRLFKAIAADVCNHSEFNGTSEEFRKYKNDNRIVNQKANKHWKTGVVLMFFAMLLPSQSAIYLMLGSEIGEQAIETELGKRIQSELSEALDAVLDRLPDSDGGDQ